MRSLIGNMNGLVVFYSRTGNTKRIAQELADELDWDIEEIHDIKKRAGIIGWLRSGFDAFREKLTEIKPLEKNPADYEMVLLGTPVWASKMTPAIRTYIKQNKENLNSTAFFCTEGAKGAEKLMKSLDMSFISWINLSSFVR